MLVIGLTGSIASGKSTVASILGHANIPVIDADKLARLATQKGSLGLKEIIECFGKEFLDHEGHLDRKKLAKLVFSNKDALKKLESIVHPKIEELRFKALNYLRGKGKEVAVYMAPLLFEKNLQNSVDKTLLIMADEEILINRLKKRDNFSTNESLQRIGMQMPNNVKQKLANEVIVNNGSIDELTEKLKSAWMKLTNQNLTLK